MIIRRPNGLETWYAHLTKRNVGSEEYVRAGQVIGYGGSTGRSRGPHLHFEIRYCDQTFDPERLLDFETGQLKYQTFALEKSYFNIRSRASDQLEDHDTFEEYAFAAPGEEGEELTSEEIIRRIENGGATRATTTASASAAASSSGDATYHTIVSGDMLGKIARRYGVSVGQICRLNNMRETDVLKLGRKLRVR